MKIEAGKYYRTRGGERVGPAVRDLVHGFADDGFVWRVGEYTYRDDGTFSWIADDADIVAEWDDAAAPKFQPGDRVRCLGDAEDQFTKGKVYTVREFTGMSIRVVEDDNGSKNGWLAEKFEHADTPTPNNPCIKTVTRREVVPGEMIFDCHACLQITEVGSGDIPNVVISGYAFTATALREAATAFSEIADALDEAGQ